MSKTKEFYFDEICQSQQEIDVDDDYFFSKWQAEQAFNSSVSGMMEKWEDNQERDLEEEQQIAVTFDLIQKDVNAAELPSWMHPSL